MSPVRLTLIGFFVLFLCQAREENAAFCFSQSTFSLPSSTPALHSGTSEPILPLVFFLWHCYLVGFKSFVAAARAAAARHRNGIQKKKKNLWNSLQNLLWMGQLWQKSESPVNLPHSVQPKAAERQHSSSGNSRTRPAAVTYASSETRGDARGIIIAFAQRLCFLWSRPAQIVIDTKTRLIARPHFEPSYRSRWRRRRRVACVTIH